MDGSGTVEVILWPQDVLARMPRVIADRVREMRRLLGLSQQQVADRAGVSQGAVSRMEAASCPEMPLHTILAVLLVLTLELLPVQDSCSADVRGVLDVVRATCPLLVEQELHVFADSGLNTLVRAYGALSEQRRQTFLEICLAVAGLVSRG